MTMADLEMSEYHSTVHEFGAKARASSADTQQSERWILRIGILTLGVLCLIQATLNISLRLVFYSKQDTTQFPVNISEIEELCQADQTGQNSSQSQSCCNYLTRRLLKEYKALETERDHLLNMISEQYEYEISGDFEEFASA